jgi:hypothetical protein
MSSLYISMEIVGRKRIEVYTVPFDGGRWLKIMEVMLDLSLEVFG